MSDSQPSTSKQWPLQIIASIFLIIATSAICVSYSVGLSGLLRNSSVRDGIAWIEGYEDGRIRTRTWQSAGRSAISYIASYFQWTHSAYIDGFTRGQQSLTDPSASILNDCQGDQPLISPSDVGLLHRREHIIAGAKWINYGIRHMDELYDVSPSGQHFPTVVRGADALLTEDGYYFENARRTAIAINPQIITDTLHETRIRIHTLRAPIEFLGMVFLASFMVIFAALIALCTSDVWKNSLGCLYSFCGRSSNTLTSKSRSPLKRIRNVSFMAIGVSLIACFFLFMGSISWLRGSGRPRPFAAIHPPPSMVDRFTYSWDEACEMDSQSMYRNLMSFIERHPTIITVATITGNSHAQDFERYHSLVNR